MTPNPTAALTATTVRPMPIHVRGLAKTDGRVESDGGASVPYGVVPVAGPKDGCGAGPGAVGAAAAAGAAGAPLPSYTTCATSAALIVRIVPSASLMRTPSFGVSSTTIPRTVPPFFR